MQSLDTIHQYLERHSDEIGNRILASYPALYGADEAPSPLLSRMIRVPYPAQTLAIMATRSNRSRRLYSAVTAVRASQPASLAQHLSGEHRQGPAKTVQGILRHSRIQTTLDLYTQGDSDETRAAQGEFLKALGMPSGAMQ